MNKIDRANDFISKAEKHLRWAKGSIRDLKESGENSTLDKIEKDFFSLLSSFEIIFQAIVDAAKKLELSSLRDEINSDRNNDVLLKYLRFARNSEVHDAVLKWHSGMMHLELKVIAPDKGIKKLGRYATQETIAQYIFGVNSRKRLKRAFSEKRIPSKKRCEELGVQITLNIESLSLKSFTTGQGKGKKNILSPSNHLGKPMPPSAWDSVNKGFDYYNNKLMAIKDVRDRI